MPAFNILPVDSTSNIAYGSTGVSTNDADALIYYDSGSTVLSGLSNWQLAMIQSDTATQEIEFHITGSKNTELPPTTSPVGFDSNPVINGLQIIPVVDFLQPDVTRDNKPLEYGPLKPGTYALTYITGAVDVNRSQPRFAGGWYRLLYSTNNTAPSQMRLNYPEIDRYMTGGPACSAYAGKQYLFNHQGGYISLAFDDIANYYTDNQISSGGATGPYISLGVTYPVGYTDASPPVAPVFALIDLTALSYQNNMCNPVLYNPTQGDLASVLPMNISLLSTTPNADIYYTITSSLDMDVEPPDPDTPTVDAQGNPGPTTIHYDGEVIPISYPTKIKAFARHYTPINTAPNTDMLDSPVSSAYYRKDSNY